MKLSQMTNTQVADSLAEITPLIATIFDDDKIERSFKACFSTTGVKGIAGLKFANLLLSTHREEAWGVLACLNSMPVEEIGEQKLLVTLQQVMELISDKDLISFFISFTS